MGILATFPLAGVWVDAFHAHPILTSIIGIFVLDAILLSAFALIAGRQ